MKIDLLTLFPAMAHGVLAESILGRAQRAGLVEIRVHQLRDYAKDKHHTVDDRPFGGGPGMVMKAEPLVDAIEHLRGEGENRAHVVFLTPEGSRLNQPMVRRFVETHSRLLLISGHYEGIDERVRQGWIDEEISIGDYILSNGTLPALTLIDAMVRLIPGVFPGWLARRARTHRAVTTTATSPDSGGSRAVGVAVGVSAETPRDE
jgi:tRNA (guanine37-N1)-methyltransferase